MTAMADFAWWQRAVIYQIYPRSFKDTSGNGVGDLQGIIDKLDYLVALGVDAVWISPFYKSPMADFGYDVADYTDVDPLFGDLATFDALVAAMHARNLKLIVDWVPNHTSTEHAWFQASRQNQDNPKADWYIWRDAKPDGSLPNNWGSVFGGPAWTWDEQRSQYYFHQFDPGQPDLNWRNPAVRAAMYDTLRFWMRRGVDGFRMDVVYMIWKHPDMPDQPLNADAQLRGSEDLFGTQQQIYAFNYDGIHDIMRDMRQVLDEHNAFAVGEIWLDLHERMTYYAGADGLHMPFNFDLIANANFQVNQWSAGFVREKVDAYEAAVPPHGWPNYVLGSHDVPRLASRVGQAQTGVAAVLLLTLRGTPTLYMGDEIGMVNGDIAPDQVQDPQGKRLGLAHTRDVTRTPMQWDASAYAGFSSVAPWLPVNADYSTRNVAAQQADPNSLLALYQRLLRLRKGSQALTVGDYRPINAPDGVFAYVRSAADDHKLVALNFTGAPQALDLPEAGPLILSTDLAREQRREHITGQLQLAPNEAVILDL